MDFDARYPRRFGCPAEAVLLDAAGTLIRPREPIEQTYAAAARRFGVELDPGKLLQSFDAVLDEMPDLAFHPRSTEHLHCKERGWWQDFVRRVVRLAGCSRGGDFDGFFETLYEHYAQSHAWECFFDVLPVLRALRAKDCKLAVVSNFDSRLPGILRDLGIWGYMDAVVYSSEAGSAKPDPAIFKKALAALGVPAEQALHVGDNPRDDVAGAAAAGIRGLLIRRDNLPLSGSGSDSVIGSLADLVVRSDGGNALPLSDP
jgi:putative hydrolase of the HAD superfamily